MSKRYEPQLRPDRAYQLIKARMEAAISLLNLTSVTDADVRNWESTTLTVLEHAFGPEHRNIGDFMTANVQAIRRIRTARPTEAERETHRRSRLEFQAVLLEGYLEQLVILAESHTDTEVPTVTDSKGVEVEAASIENRKKIFVVHGRNESARRALFAFLRAIGLHPLEWSEAVRLTGKASPYVGEVLDAAFAHAQAVIVLLTGDDEVRLRPDFVHPDDGNSERQFQLQARPNVLFEAGMALARDASRTILVTLGICKPFSDVGGRHAVYLSDDVSRRRELLSRLQTAGCNVADVIHKDDWLKEGAFDTAVAGVAEGVAVAAATTAVPQRIIETEFKPEVAFEVHSGKTVVVTVMQRGPAFKMVLRAQIVKASKPVDQANYFEYFPRTFGSGDAISAYTLCAIDRDTSKVLVVGEGMTTIQEWDYSVSSLSFSIALRVLSVRDGHTDVVATSMISVTFNRLERRFQAHFAA